MEAATSVIEVHQNERGDLAHDHPDEEDSEQLHHPSLLSHSVNASTPSSMFCGSSGAGFACV